MSWGQQYGETSNSGVLRGFRVRHAGTLTGFGVALILAGQVLAALGVLVGLADLQAAVATGGAPAGTTLAIVGGGWLATTIGVGCVVGGFIKLCTNVEYLVRDAVDRRGGDAG